MKIDELISELEQVKEKHGNLETEMEINSIFMNGKGNAKFSQKTEEEIEKITKQLAKATVLEE